MEEKAKQASVDVQEELNDLTNGRYESVLVSTGRRVKVYPSLPSNEDKIDDVFTKYNARKAKKKEKMLSDPFEMKAMNSETRKYFAKLCAAMIIHGYFNMKFNFWWKWRWIYRHSGWTAMDYMLIISVFKKKRMEEAYYWVMGLSVEMTQMWTTMTMKEAEQYLRELKSAREQRS